MRVPITGLSSLGMVADQSPHELPAGAFSSVSNMRVQDGALESFEGHAKAFSTPAVAPIWLMSYPGASQFAWLYASAAKVYVHQGGTHYNLTPQALGVDVDYTGIGWKGCSLNGVPVLTNNAEVPQMWNPADTATLLQNLTAWPAGVTAAVIRPFKNYLIALDITKSGTRYQHLIKWSHPADAGTVPTSWDETDATKDAGELPLAETGGALVDCLPLRNSNVIYKEDSIYLQNFIGGVDIFGFQQVTAEAGMLTAGAVCGFNFKGPKHCLFTPSDVVVFDGNSVESILTKRMRKWLFSAINSDDLSKTVVRNNPVKSEIWICFCMDNSGRLETALVWNYTDNTFSIRTLPELTALESGVFVDSAGGTDEWGSNVLVWNADTLAWGGRAYNPGFPQLMGATDTPSGEWFLFDQDGTFDGGEITASCERIGLPIAFPDRLGQPQDNEAVKLVTEIWPRIQTSGSQLINIWVGTQMQRDDGVQWHGPYPFDPTTMRKVNPLASGKIISIKFESTGTAHWKLFGYDLEVKKIGGY